MTKFAIAAVFVAGSSVAGAQTIPHGPAPTSQTGASAAGVAARMQAQGYSGIQDLHHGPDGKWTGQAMRNGVPVTVTVEPQGTLTAR